MIQCYNPFDPIQDTERVAVSSASASNRGYNPFDPIQDTESASGRLVRRDDSGLQPIRSDTGY